MTKTPKLTFVATKKPKIVNPTLRRRERLIRSIDTQVSRIERRQQGQRTGRIWYWVDEDGNYLLPIKYGKADIELEKGKFAIQCASIDGVVAALATVRSMAANGDFDATLEELSKLYRSNFQR
jgi:hypothetical protein